MVEPLSDDARLVLAFIRDHPGLREIAIMKQLGFDEPRFVVAFKQLQEAKLIFKHFNAHPNPKSLDYDSGYSTYYPA